MIEFRENDREVEMMRQTTEALLATDHLPDDNNLLHYLSAAEYLKDDALTGYLPAALCSYHEEPDAAELFVDIPIGERGLTTNGGPSFSYRSPHSRLHRIYGVLDKALATDTGNVVEVRSGARYFLPKAPHTLSAKVRHGRLNQSAVDTECERLGLAGVASSDEYVSADYQGIHDLSFTRAVRLAAQWASYTLKNPWDSDTRNDYPRVLNVNEAELCLKVVIEKIKNQKPYADISVIKNTVQA